MRLPDFARTTQFRAGFVGGLLLFVAANFYSYCQMGGTLDDGFTGFGFPFKLYETGGFATVHRLVACGLIADAFVAVASSVALGLICHKLFASRSTFA
jgi:hypothetical protein